jgi:uncharacterized protein YfaS (alpha-2-macroglobulin family)
VPDFNGSLRLMAVAASGERFGMQEAEVTVAAPLVVELATPRFLSVGDSALLALDVHNLAGAEQEVKIKVSNGDGLVIKNGEQKVTPQGPAEAHPAHPARSRHGHRPHRSAGQDRKPADEAGPQLPAAGAGPDAAADGAEALIVEPGRNAGGEGGRSRRLPQANRTATLSVSDKAPIDVRSAVQGLLTYPYGCAEQTTSTAYPHVFIDEAAAKQFGLKPYTQAQRAEMLDKAIAAWPACRRRTVASACGATSPSTSTGSRPTSPTS